MMNLPVGRQAQMNADKRRYFIASSCICVHLRSSAFIIAPQSYVRGAASA
jgi:hypothetical protein